ncbi:MAG: DNA-binding response regulator [Bacteroidia bacterium]
MTQGYKKAILIIALAQLLANSLFANGNRNTQNEMVVLRLIGHKLLQHAGDSTSRVLPISKRHNQYTIKFENEFAFNPDSLVSIINKQIKNNDNAEGYNVQVLDCDSQKVVYDFEVNFKTSGYLIPCRGRNYPVDCYEIRFSFFNSSTKLDTIALASVENQVKTRKSTSSKWVLGFSILAIIVVAGVIIYKRKPSKKSPNEDWIAIGDYKLNKKLSILKLNEKEEELSGKELDLLLLLNKQINVTVEREEMLNKVWNDEGAYVGRTLDVFISKLRKKLEADDKVKIVNVRGVGYKLVVTD